MQKAYYDQQPSRVTYMRLPNGQADVWLRKNIQQETDADGNVGFTCDETYLRTSLSETDVNLSFDALINYTAPEHPSLESRVEAVEEALLAMMEVSL